YRRGPNHSGGSHRFCYAQHSAIPEAERGCEPEFPGDEPEWQHYADTGHVHFLCGRSPGPGRRRPPGERGDTDHCSDWATNDRTDRRNEQQPANSHRLRAVISAHATRQRRDVRSFEEFLIPHSDPPSGGSFFVWQAPKSPPRSSIAATKIGSDSYG